MSDGSSTSSSTGNYTIDDSQWNTPALSLSPGWNMLRPGSAEYISAEEVELMRPLLSGFYNSSYSWNTHAGCSNTITFLGSGITAYGLAGPDSGNYSVTLDGGTTMHSALAEGTRYAHVLFSVDKLDPEANHTLTFTNVEDGRWFGFDYAVVTTGPVEHLSASNATDESAAPPVAPAINFTLPEALTAPLQLLMPPQTQPEQMALLTQPYHFHWTAGAYFTVIVAAIGIACLYVFFLFQIGGMLRDRNGGALPTTAGAAAAAGGGGAGGKRNKRSSWSSRGSGGSNRPRPTTRVVQALKNKKISAPSPIPEEYDDGKLPLSSDASSSGEGSGSRDRHDGALPRLTFAPDERAGIASGPRMMF